MNYIEEHQNEPNMWKFLSRNKLNFAYRENDALARMKAHQHTQLIKDELMRITWYPTRVLNWCYDAETQERISSMFNLSQ